MKQIALYPGNSQGVWLGGIKAAHPYTSCPVQRPELGDIFPWKGEESSLERQCCLTMALL